MDLIYTWSELKAVRDRIEEIEHQTDAIIEAGFPETSRIIYNKLWDERHALEEKRDAMQKQVIPEVGMPCTVKYYSDSSGGNIIAIPSPKHIVVKQDGVYSGVKEFTYRRNGRWVQKGTTSRDWGTLCYLGYKHNYYDQSF